MVDLKDPKLLAIGAVALVAGYVLLKNKGSTSGSVTPVDTSGGATTGSTAETGNNAIGGTYTYLDGSGVQHIIATDPQGNLTSYAAEQPSFSSPSQGQLSTYSGYQGTFNNSQWMYGGSPAYATNFFSTYPGLGYASTSTLSSSG